MMPALLVPPSRRSMNPPASAFGVSAAFSTVATSIDSIANDGVAVATITATILDVSNTGVAGITPTMTATGAGNTIGSFGATNSFGVATATFSTTGATDHVITVVAQGVTLAQTVTVTGSGSISVSTSQSTVTIAASAAAGSGTVPVVLQARDSGGNAVAGIGLTVVFGHSGGTSVISIGSTTDNGDGTYTAQVTPTTAGTATTMSATIGGVNVTSTMPTFTVTAASSLDPGNLTLLNSSPFSLLSTSSSVGVEGRQPTANNQTETARTRGTLISDSTAPLSPNSVYQIKYAAGDAAGTSPVNTLWFYQAFNHSPKYTKVYWKFGVMVSSNWQGHSSNVNKFGFMWVGPSAGSGSARCYIDFHGAGSNSLYPQLTVQSIPGDADGNADQWINNTGAGSSAIMTRGVWYTMEVYMELNSGALVADGIFKMTMNGTLTHNYNTVIYRGTGEATYGWTQHELKPIWGGNAGTTVTNDMYMYVDDITVKAA